MTLVIHLHNHRILALCQQVADVEVKGGEATYVLTSLLPVHPDVTVIVHSTEVEQHATLLHRHSLKALLEPDSTLVEEQSFVLCVPVAWDLHGGRLVEVVFYQIFRTLRLGILEESPLHGFHAVVVVALLLHVNDVVPLAIEQHRLVGIHILDQWQFLTCPSLRKHRPRHQH